MGESNHEKAADYDGRRGAAVQHVRMPVLGLLMARSILSAAMRARGGPLCNPLCAVVQFVRVGPGHVDNHPWPHYHLFTDRAHAVIRR
jgi:hypothetical protein